MRAQDVRIILSEVFWVDHAIEIIDKPTVYKYIVSA